jgi:LPXTG-motif cell wall-anchored protein
LVLPDFTIIVLLVLGGTMAGISGFVLVKTRK